MPSRQRRKESRDKEEEKAGERERESTRKEETRRREKRKKKKEQEKGKAKEGEERALTATRRATASAARAAIVKLTATGRQAETETDRQTDRKRQTYRERQREIMSSLPSQGRLVGCVIDVIREGKFDFESSICSVCCLLEMQCDTREDGTREIDYISEQEVRKSDCLIRVLWRDASPKPSHVIGLYDGMQDRLSSL